MLIKFAVGNYLSFKDIVTLDMTAEALKEEKSSIHIPYLHNPKVSVLKSAVIYGYNAFGKSNLIKAYSTFRHYILNSFALGSNSSDLKTEPFRLNTSMLNKPSYFEATFIIKQTKYRYGFEVADQKIISEWLYYSDGPVRENPLFNRGYQEFRDVSKLWNKSADNKVEQARIFTKSNNLFLTVLLSQEGIPRIEEIESWFRGNLILKGEYSNLINDGAAQIYTKEEYRSIILKFLDNADLGFKSIFEKISNLTNKGIHADIVKSLYDIEQTNFELYTHHQVLDDNHVFQKMVEFHLQKNESSGSIKYFIVSCFLAYALKRGQLIWIDELDASLHTQLLLFIAEIFNSEKNNVNGAQLIFTTHNTVMLDNILRRDQIWFVDKNEYGESSLHKGHTKETPIRINKSIEQEYRTGKLKKGSSRKVNPKNLPSLFDDNLNQDT
jgi:uncharacterized protein